MKGGHRQFLPEKRTARRTQEREKDDEKTSMREDFVRRFDQDVKLGFEDVESRGNSDDVSDSSHLSFPVNVNLSVRLLDQTSTC